MAEATRTLQERNAGEQALAREGMRTVLIFAHECAPYNRPESTIGAQRPAQFARWLPEFGWRAIVLCCDSARRGTGWTERDRAAVRGAMRAAGAGESVVIATPSLPHDGLLDRAWQRAMRGNGARAAALVRKPLTFAKFFTGDYSQPWQPCAREAARIVAEEARIDAVIGEHSPDAGIFLARWFSRRYHVPWLADFRDPMLFGYSPRVRPLLEPFARRMLLSASHVIAVNRHCAAIDEALFQRPSTTIPNGFDPEDFAGEEPERRGGPLRIGYVGSVWPPGGLGIFFEGLGEFASRIGPDRRRRITFVYRGNASAMVVQFARSAGVDDLLDCASHIPHANAVELMRSAHVLLVLSGTSAESSDPYWAKGVCPGKVFEYIGARRPVMCVPGDRGLLDELLATTGAGASYGTPHEVASYLEKVSVEWERMGDVAQPANEHLVMSCSRRVGAERLTAVLDGVMSEVMPALVPRGTA